MFGQMPAHHLHLRCEPARSRRHEVPVQQNQVDELLRKIALFDERTERRVFYYGERDR